MRRDKAPVVELLWNLSPTAHDHYPLNHGLSQEESFANADLYPAGVPIRLGLGDFISGFLRDFSHCVNSQDLRRRDGRGELEELLDVLEENL